MRPPARGNSVYLRYKTCIGPVRIVASTENRVRRASSLTTAVGAIAVALFAAVTPARAAGEAHAAASVRHVDFRGDTVSPHVQRVAAWAVHSRDHGRYPFIIVDKLNAKATAFDPNGRLIRTVPILIGMGMGDTFPPGVTSMKMQDTQPWQRVTPAGRYLAEEGKTPDGKRVLWVDYDNAIAIHKIPSKETSQRRHERIKSDNPAEHRITFGCINVPVTFYDEVVRPHFKKHGGIVYVLPDSKPVEAVFTKIYNVPERGPSLQHAVGRAEDAGRPETHRF